MIKHWNEFQGSPNRMETDRPRVTLNSRGVILLNSKAFEAMETPAAVTLLFDENNNIIGLKPADIRRTNTFPVKQKDKMVQPHHLRESVYTTSQHPHRPHRFVQRGDRRYRRRPKTRPNKDHRDRPGKMVTRPQQVTDKFRINLCV